MNIPSIVTLPEILQESPSSEATSSDFSHLFSYLDNIADLGLNFFKLDTSPRMDDASVDSWDKFDHQTIDKDASTPSLPSLPSSPARGVLSPSWCFPIQQSDKKRKRRTPKALEEKSNKKKKQPKKTQKKIKTKSAFSSLTCVTKIPQYVIRCGDDPPRYGVKMKLCKQNVRIGCNYTDMCSAGHVALEAKKRVMLTSSNTFKLRENNNKSVMRVSVYIQGKAVQRSIHSILHGFISVFNIKRSRESPCELKQSNGRAISTSSSAEDAQQFETGLTRVKYAKDFTTKMKKLQDEYAKDLECMYTNLVKARSTIVKAIGRYESEGNVVDGDMAVILELLKKSAIDMGILEKALYCECDLLTKKQHRECPSKDGQTDTKQETQATDQRAPSPTHRRGSDTIVLEFPKD